MLDFNGFKLIHLLSVFTVLVSLGVAASTEKAQSRWAGAAHGIALVLVLVAGFGMLAKLGITGAPPAWVIGKLAVWLALGGMIAVARRKLLPTGIFVGTLIALAGIASCLALWKP